VGSGNGGAGGGGTGWDINKTGSAGTANTGGGGGGARFTDPQGGAGGSGIVIFRYLTADAASAGISVSGGTVTTSGGYTIHSFTSTGSTTVTVA